MGFQSATLAASNATSLACRAGNSSRQLKPEHGCTSSYIQVPHRVASSPSYLRAPSYSSRVRRQISAFPLRVAAESSPADTATGKPGGSKPGSSKPRDVIPAAAAADGPAVVAGATAVLEAPAVLQPSTAAGSDPDAVRLVPRVEERNGYWVLKEEYRTSLNPAEKIKIAKEPMTLIAEGAKALRELALKTMAEVDGSKETKDDIDSRFKWLGLFHRRKQQYGRFMMRLRLPNGIITSEQTRFLADVIARYGEEGVADITTRQNWQIRGVTLQDTPDIIDGLNKVNLRFIQSGMDNARNVVGNPLAGIDPLEIIDTRPFCQAIDDVITGHGEGNTALSNLPRKWNASVVGSHDLFEHPHINDLAFMPALRRTSDGGSEGEMGFEMHVGGFFSSKRCEEAIPMDAWVPAQPADVAAASKAVLEAFRDLGSRSNRQKTRMMYLIEDLGMEVFRAEVEKRMPNGHLPRVSTAATSNGTTTTNAATANPSVHSLIDPSWSRRSYLGVHPQKQPGLVYVGLHVPVGRVHPPTLHELARLAEEYGSGEVRLTVEQNVIIPNVPEGRVAELLKEPLLVGGSGGLEAGGEKGEGEAGAEEGKGEGWYGLRAQPGNLMGSLVACTGNQFCGQAIIETKQRALQVTRQLEETLNLPDPVRIHWTGCPNSCAQVQVADIGLMGCMARDENKKPVEGVDIYMGGRIGSDSHLGQVHKAGVPCKDLVPVLQDILVERAALLALSLALLLAVARAGSPLTSATANEKPDPSSKKDDGLMTEVPADIAMLAVTGNAAGVTYVDTAQDSFFMADVKKAGWNAQKCPPGLNKELAGACTPKNCSKGGIPAKWKTAYLQKNKLGYELYVPGNPLTLLKANPASCCNTCAATPLCTYWQYIPDITIDGKKGKGACYLIHDQIDFTCGEMTAQYSTETKPVNLQVRIGGECNPSAKILNDPHLVGAHGTHFDFNGRPDKAFCLLTDRDLHVNMLLRGYYDERTDNAALVVDGKAVHTWIKELGIVWTAQGADHKVRLAARGGKQQERGDGFMKSIEIDGEEIPRMKVGDTVTSDGGLTVHFRGLEKEGPFDVDYYMLTIDGLISLDLRLRVAHPKLQTPTDAEAHINVGIAELEHTEEIHGVLGQTYRADHSQRASDFQRLIASLHRPISADGAEGKGFLDGTPRSYEASDVLAVDCAYTAYGRARKVMPVQQFP
ncbi:unnamed protein product [Closterium sp. Naga37s-1]|nr:unnamed protein product [Closterium sp. Naga37s-1]